MREWGQAVWVSRGAVGVALGLSLACLDAGAQTQKAAGPSIYSCDVNGKRITSDRPIPECNNRDQRELNPDGSFKRNVPPPPTADERA
jgi:hypothetical protein